MSEKGAQSPQDFNDVAITVSKKLIEKTAAVKSLDPALAARLEAEGRAMSTDEAIAYALEDEGGPPQSSEAT